MDGRDESEEREAAFETRLDAFVSGCEKLPPAAMYGSLHVDRGSRFCIVRGTEKTPSYPSGYVFARVETSSGDIYSQSGDKPRGSIYSERNGLDAVDCYGVIVNAKKLAMRAKSLSSEIRSQV